MKPAEPLASTFVVSLDGKWLLAPDPANRGREEHWWRRPAPGARLARVPGVIQEVFPAYHGVAWYWREVVPPANPHLAGRYLVRFWAVDYMADVWLNGAHVGQHEGGESVFVLDVTEAIRAGEANLLAVRMLNPTTEPIDGIVLGETPHRNKAVPFFAGADFNHGGIEDSVELLAAPPLRVEDLYVRPDAATGRVDLQLNLRNAGAAPVDSVVEVTIAPAAGGETLSAMSLVQRVPAGLSADRRTPGADAVVETALRVDSPRLWELNAPYLYRVTARVRAEDGAAGGSFDERSVRCSFRDFRFEDGYFRLNGRRLFLRCSHTGNSCPLGLHVPHDPDVLRRDLLNVKAMGFNAIRFIAGVARREQLDLCDELGLMVYEESYACWCLEDSPRMAERYDESVAGMIRRDRNHPSIVIWGLLNETPDGPVFRHAVGALSLVRALDDTRMVMLGSGRWDGQLDIGSLCNPGSEEWERLLGAEAAGAEPTHPGGVGGYWQQVGDAHAYPRVPHTAETIRFLRGLGEGTGPVFLSEYGIGSAVDLVRVVAMYEQLGQGSVEDAALYRGFRDRFLEDWERWGMQEAFASPGDYFRACLAKMAGQRLLGLNAIRANPNLVGYSLTGTVDQGWTGEGLTTTFREFKPGTMDAMADGLAPLRLCVFAEPANVYRGSKVKIEVVLADEGVLRPGQYPLRVLVVGPGQRLVMERRTVVVVPEVNGRPERPFAIPVFAEEVTVDGPDGEYRCLAAFERGAAAAGGEARFYVADPAEVPRIETPVTLWGGDSVLTAWLEARGAEVRRYRPGASEQPEVILVGEQPEPPGGEVAFRDLADRISCGASAVFLSPGVFAENGDPVAWLPLAQKGRLVDIPGWLYLKDEWAKAHPIFEGLPAGGLMDYTFYREIIPDALFQGQEPPLEAVAGAIKASQGYDSGLMVAVYGLGAGRFVVNTLLVRENLDRHPAADRLLVNMLRYARGRAGVAGHQPDGPSRQ